MDERICDCGMVERLAHGAEAPVLYDAQSREYRLSQTGMPLEFCFHCGGRLPAQGPALAVADDEVDYQAVLHELGSEEERWRIRWERKSPD